jgi:dTDP-4-dehydrorhamnose 3,5-epimerase
MRFLPTNIEGAWIVELEPMGDERGFFARAFCRREFADQGIDFDPVQVNLVVTRDEGTFRGLHYQIPPSDEAKFIRCISGSLFDAVVDLRPDSSTYLRCHGITLSSENRRAIVVPARCAHGYLTLERDTEALYAAADLYRPGLERGLRYDDPIVTLEWPIAPVHVSERDRSWPDFEPNSRALR